MKMDNAIIKLGRMYEMVFNIPVFGNKMCRRLCKNIASITFYTPFMKMKKHNNIQGVKEEFLKLDDMYGGEVIISKEDETSFEYLSSPCPYGYSRDEQRGVCDAAMDMNRQLLKLCGAKLIIHERISMGAPQCRATIRMIKPE